MRANSLTNLGVALDYNVSSEYDKVLVVAGLAEKIEALAPYASQIGEIVANLPDVLTVQQAVDVLNNLTVSITTLPESVPATIELVGTEIRLGIPKGDSGPRGYDGLTPMIEFSIDDGGNLVYEVVNWLDISTGNTLSKQTEEW
mgnify:CR=1 FL=1